MNYKIAVLSIALAFSSSTFAGFSGPGGTAPSVSTVKLVSEMNDDTKVILEGRLVNQLKDEHYTFKDATGEIEIEIDDKNFKGVDVTPDINVRITGEVDKEWSTVTIDVDRIEIIK